MVRTILLAGVAASLSGCGLAPATAISIVSPILSYVASVNNLGAEALRFTDDGRQTCPVTPP